MDPRTVAREAKVSHARLLELVHYDPATGNFASCAGAPSAHVVKANGYLIIRLDGVAFMAHRVAWLYMTGAWPRETIDHIDRVRSNNRFDNLREATIGEQRQNLPVRRDSRSGIQGVSWVGRRRQWRARISVGGAKMHLGWFSSAADAAAAYAAAKAKLHTFHPQPSF